MRIITFSFILLFCIGNADISAQSCTNTITSYKVYKESFSTGSTTSNVLADLKLDGQGHLCMDHATMLDAPKVFSNVVDVTQGDIQARRQAMVFYHLAATRKYANDNLSMGIVSALDGELSFTVEDIGDPLFMVDKPSSTVTIDYRKRDSQSEGGVPYNAFAEDAFAIASGYFQATHINSLVFISKASDTELPSNEGVQYSISDYLAYRYMSHNGYNTGTNIYVHAGVGSDEWSTLNIDFDAIDYEYGTDDFNDGKNSQQQSELLSASLHRLTEILNYDISGNNTGNGNTKVDAMVLNSMVNMNNSTVDNQGAAAQILYDQGVINGLEEFDLCRILNFFTYIYGDAFFKEVTYIPSALEGDIFIKDNAEDNGAEASVGSVHNSPSLWNRHSQDFQSVHQSPTPVYTTHEVVTNYIHVKLNGDFCDLAAVSKGSSLKMQVHFSINGTASWPTKWNHTTQNFPKGDLIGILDFATGEWTDDYNNTIILDNSSYRLHASILQNEVPYITISLPYRVAPFRSWSPLKFGKKATLGFHAILVSDTFDPLSLSALGSNVELNTRNKNNIALKNTIIIPRGSGVIQIPSEPNTKSYSPLIIPGDPDPDPVTPDPDYTIVLIPGTHDPNSEENDDPDYQVLPDVHNDYFDYGQVIFALDDALFASWQVGGGRGQGFIINSDNEIEVIGRNFKLEGLPYPAQGLENIIGFNFISNTLPGRTGFDIVQSRPTGEVIAKVHVEVREALGGPRSKQQNLTSKSITIYPNPTDGTTLHLDNITLGGSYTIHGLDGKLQSSGKYTKDQKSLDISMLKNGVYFIRFTKSTGAVETKKMIKM